jgi:hypothetical protein
LTIVPNMAGSIKAESPKAACSIQSDPLQILALIAGVVFSWSANFGDFAGSGLAEGNFPYAFSLPVRLLDRFDTVTGAQTAAASASLFI